MHSRIQVQDFMYKVSYLSPPFSPSIWEQTMEKDEQMKNSYNKP